MSTTKSTKMPKQTAKLNAIGREIVDAPLGVHGDLVPGLLESVCAHCLSRELTKGCIDVKRQTPVPVVYTASGGMPGLSLTCIRRYAL